MKYVALSYSQFQQMNRLTMMKCGINKLNSWCIPWNNECTLDYMEHAGKLMFNLCFLGDRWMDGYIINQSRIIVGNASKHR